MFTWCEHCFMAWKYFGVLKLWHHVLNSCENVELIINNLCLSTAVYLDVGSSIWVFWWHNWDCIFGIMLLWRRCKINIDITVNVTFVLASHDANKSRHYWSFQILTELVLVWKSCLFVYWNHKWHTAHVYNQSTGYTKYGPPAQHAG